MMSRRLKSLTLVCLFASLLCLAQDEQVRFVNGKIARQADEKNEIQNSENKSREIERSTFTRVQTWEIRAESESEKSATENRQKADANFIDDDSNLPSHRETLAQKLARINREKFASLDNVSQSWQTAQAIEQKPDEGLEHKIVDSAKAIISTDKIDKHMSVNLPQNDFEQIQQAPKNIEIDSADIDALVAEREKLLSDLQMRLSIKNQKLEQHAKKIDNGAESSSVSAITSEIARSQGNPAAQNILKERQKLDDKLKAALIADIEKSEVQELEENLPAPLKFYQAQTDNLAFIIFSKNLAARNLGFSVAKNADEVIASYLGAGSLIKKPIEIQMIMPEDAQFEGFFFESVGNGADIVLLVKCSPDLPLGAFCERVVYAYLRAIAYVEGGQKGFFEVPNWLELALNVALAQNISRGVTYEFARYAEFNQPSDFAEVLKYKKENLNTSNIKEYESSAYWSLLALKAAAKGKDDMSFILKKVLSNGSDTEATLKEFTKRFGQANFADYWRAVLCGEIYARLGGVKNLINSDIEISRFSILLRQRKGEPLEAVSDSEVLEKRRELKNELKTRLVEIKLALPWINPIYYNALVSLGRMYEFALDGDDDEFVNSRNDFLSELKKSRELSKRTYELLKN